jgi:hypothetical protein
MSASMAAAAGVARGGGRTRTSPAAPVNVSSGLAGGTIGYNAQNLGSFIFGEEFDFDWRGVTAIVPPAACAPNCEFKSAWLATARLRFGYAIDRFLP